MPNKIVDDDTIAAIKAFNHHFMVTTVALLYSVSGRYVFAFVEYTLRRIQEPLPWWVIESVQGVDNFLIVFLSFCLAAQMVKKIIDMAFTKRMLVIAGIYGILPHRT